MLRENAKHMLGTCMAAITTAYKTISAAQLCTSAKFYSHIFSLRTQMRIIAVQGVLGLLQ